MKKLTAAVAGLALMLTGAAHAQSSLLDGWSGSANLGLTFVRGDAESDSVAAGIRISKTVGKWEHLLFGSLIHGSTTVVIANPPAPSELIEADSAERLLIGYQPKYYWRPRTYFFGLFDFETDEPGNIDTAFTQIIGIGHKFWTRGEDSYFAGEAGIGNSSLEPEVGPDVDSAILYGALNYRYKFTETALFYSDFRADIGDDNTAIDWNSGVSFKLSSRLAVNLSLLIYGNTDLDDNTNPLDEDFNQVFTAGLVFDI